MNNKIFIPIVVGGAMVVTKLALLRQMTKTKNEIAKLEKEVSHANNMFACDMILSTRDILRGEDNN